MCNLLLDLEKSTELWAAIIGAVIGGLIAFAIQMISLREGRTQRSEDYKRQREVLGYSLIFKVIRILSNINSVRKNFEQADLRAKHENFSGEPWQIYRAIANPPDPISFSSEEMGMLLSLNDDDVFASILHTDVRHNSLISVIYRFNQSRSDLAQSISTSGSLRSEDGFHLSHELTSETFDILRPKMIEVNCLAKSLKEAADKYFESGQRNLFHLHKLFKDSLGFQVELQMLSNQGDKT
jgi:hypothetical protein